MQVQVCDLKPGMLVDLEGDPYADPLRDHPSDQFEYRVVTGIEEETPTCVRVDFEEGNSVGFPPDHELKVRK